MKNEIPVIISCDIDPTPEIDHQERIRAFASTIGLFSDFDCTATFFCVAAVAETFSSQLTTLVECGHEIGCHGLSHDETDEYGRLPEKEQQRRLIEATEMLTGVTGRPVLSFRGPRVKTSAVTQRILVDLGYRIDSSVCSQRLDFVSSNLINWGWIFAPRRPYTPSLTSPFRRGTRPLLVIPVSALGLPFISSMLNTFGQRFTCFLFDLLYFESRKTGKPIVYLMHPGEFAWKSGQRPKQYSLKIEGIKQRRSPLIFEQNVEKRYNMHVELFRHMTSRKNVRFMTMAEYEQKYGDSYA